jgi:hypothetical protein
MTYRAIGTALGIDAKTAAKAVAVFESLRDSRKLTCD